MIAIDNPPVNALSRDVRAGLVEALDEAIADSSVRAIVVACAGNTFCAGADIREFDLPRSRRSADVIQRFEDAGKRSSPRFTATRSAVARAGRRCHYRFAARGTRIRLPEITSGCCRVAAARKLPRSSARRRAGADAGLQAAHDRAGEVPPGSSTISPMGCSRPSLGLRAASRDCCARPRLRLRCLTEQRRSVPAPRRWRASNVARASPERSSRPSRAIDMPFADGCRARADFSRCALARFKPCATLSSPSAGRQAARRGGERAPRSLVHAAVIGAGTRARASPSAADAGLKSR